MKINLDVDRDRSGTHRALDSDHDSEVAGILDYVRQSHGVWRFVRSFLRLWIRILRVGIVGLSSLVFQILEPRKVSDLRGVLRIRGKMTDTPSLLSSSKVAAWLAWPRTRLRSEPIGSCNRNHLYCLFVS